jgi:hypothetical protein
MVSGFGLKVSGFEFRAPDSGFRVSRFGFRAPGFGFRVPGSGFRAPGSGFRVSGCGFRVSGFGFQVWGAREYQEVARVFGRGDRGGPGSDLNGRNPHGPRIAHELPDFIALLRARVEVCEHARCACARQQHVAVLLGARHVSGLGRNGLRID